jgi:thiopeptide-type bacteriocin biosynthesis protein
MTKTKPKKRIIDVVDGSFFVLRTPMLPFDEFSRWSDGLWVCGELQGDAAVARAWESDVQVLRVRLREIVDRPEVRQALFVASPSLESSIESWKRDPDGKKGLQTERSLVRYFARMCGRPTPFGLFSGCSLGRIAAQGEAAPTEIVLAPRSQYRPSSRLDFDYLFALTTGLRQDPNLASELKYWPNSSLRRIGDAWHYVESKLAGTERSHNLVKLYADPFLDGVIERAQSGAMLTEMIEAVRALPDGSELTSEETRDYIEELIDSEVLVSSLTPQVTGTPALDDLITQLASLPSGRAAADTLCQTRERMAELDRRGPGVPVAEYRSIATELERLPAKLDIARLFQVDLVKPFQSALLAQPLMDELLGAVELICAVSEQGEPDEIKKFREAFQGRYEQAWVPLVQALDEDAGVGFGSSGNDNAPLLRGLPLGGGQKTAGQPSFESLLQRKMHGSAPGRQMELVIDHSELPENKDAGRTMPDCFDLQVTLVAPSMQAVREGRFRICIRGCVGPSGVRLLGRFCHADPELERHVRDLLREEEAHDPEAVYAEIVYLPEGRIGNVLCRPLLREYEITYLGRSGAPVDRQIPVSDLLVSVAVDGTILLYSRRLNRRVIPRLSNAHGFLNPRLASVYRFLCYLQHQNGVHAPSGFHWGSLEFSDFLPRVRVGRVVLACARWRLTPEEVKVLDKQDRRECFLAMQKLRHKLGLPRWVLFSEIDNTLPIDFDNALSVDAFVHVLKRGREPILTEMYPVAEDLCVTGPEGCFRHELLIPLVRRSQMAEKKDKDLSAAVDSALAVAHVPVPSSVRHLPPGSDWLYLKLYGGPAALEDVLLAEIPLLVRKAREQGIISRWFFLRYADPQQHLRIRFQGPATRLSEKMPALVFNTLSSPLASGRIWRIQFDTYEREVERYGGIEGVSLAEEIFYADSEAALDILKATEGDEGLEMRWRITMLGVDRLLRDFGLDLETKRSSMKRLRDNYHGEFQAGADTEKAIGDRFRRERRDLEALLGSTLPDNGAVQTAGRAFDIRSSRIAKAVREFGSLAESGKLCTTFPNLADSYVHMHVNRMLRSSPRAHELVIYDFLFRIYDSQLARRGNPMPAGGLLTAGPA